MTKTTIEALRAELRECRTDLDGNVMPDHAEPFGAECGLLHRAEEALAALSQGEGEVVFGYDQGSPDGDTSVEALRCPCGRIHITDIRTHHPEAQQPEAVAWAVVSPKGTILSLNATRDEADEDLAMYGDIEGRMIRPLIYGDTTPPKPAEATTPTHDGGDVMGTAENLRQVVCVKG